MKYILSCLLVLSSVGAFAQHSFDSFMSRKQMKKDLDLFYNIREAANSGVYKYRTKAEIDSIYQWAYAQIEQSYSIGDFYNIICEITDFEGSCHNNTDLPSKIDESIELETKGYFPFTIKLVEGKWVCNNTNVTVPFGSAINSINGIDINVIIPELYKYYTTDGFNTTGKKIGINYSFPYYYRLRFGKQDQFEIAYIDENGLKKITTLESISFKTYHKQRAERYSKPSDYLRYTYSPKLKETGEIYYSKLLDDSTAILCVNSFAIGGNEEDPEHQEYARFLDSTFSQLKRKAIKHLVVDVRFNSGGTAPNDIETVSYLIDKPLQDVTQAFILKDKIPFTSKLDLPWYQKPIVNIWVKKLARERTVEGKHGYFYYDEFELIKPKPDAFQGQVYLLVGPVTASAASLFAAMVAGNTDAVIIGEETLGGYYGHNGIMPITYVLPKSKIKFNFSTVNLDQNVRVKNNQPKGSGIIPDHEVLQTHQDFLNNEDTVMKYTLDLIKGK